MHRAEHRWLYAGPDQVDLFDLGECYAFGLARNHAFHDGNRRTAWAACVLFLALNGVEVETTVSAAIVQVVGRINGTLAEPDFAAWLRTIVKR